MPRRSGSKRRRAANSVQSAAQEVLQEDYDKAKVLVSDAAKSRAYLYPIKGFVYFVRRPALWKPLAAQLAPYFVLSIAVVVAMFFFAYLPQLAILIFVNGPLAVFTTVILVLNESAAIVSMLSRTLLLREALLDTFDGTLVSRNVAGGLVEEGRELHAGGSAMERLGKILKSPLEKFSLKGIIRYILYLPLNFIPIVGTFIFLLVQDWDGPGLTVDILLKVGAGYFQLKKWPESRQTDWLKIHVAPYTAFGLVATLLEMIPFISILFTFTNTVGAALWAADIEANESSMAMDPLPRSTNGGPTSPEPKDEIVVS
ncbi:uncharacterized protein DNG_02603 [Cephalotrichum gorgonifer]|uniref:Outer spore wall protein RRT8 n=1 Tax=Cephalotrichum gorgonifer TaxID=2041049 RepID=A0AAE8MU74_9PEZI|nr:uncharacterized protein DNG_02603 [Cephalotrichum gorgonifer]